MARYYYGTTAQRGYGGAHQRLRAQWKPEVDAGQAWCHAAICLKPDRHIQPGTPWHLGHTPDRQAWTGPEHERCNIAEANRRRRQRLWQQPARWVTSRSW